MGADFVRWHGSWAPEHPVQSPERSLPLYLSFDDAVARILTQFPLDTKPPRERIEAALRSGRPVGGYRLLAEAPQ